MSKFLSSRFEGFNSYVPGEQPQDRKYIKLNTNESPFPPSPEVQEKARNAAGTLNLYSDPESMQLRQAASKIYDVGAEKILPVNGSDEALDFAFMAFCDKNTPIAYPKISYGFYPVLSGLYGIESIEIPLREDLSIDYKDYVALGKNIVIANPNAPTGLALPLSEIEEIISTNPDNIVIIDEAYVDFGAESAIALTKKYSNLIVTRTFSKSHSLAGARLGFAIADEELIRDMNMIKYSTNPYNVNRVTSDVGVAAIENNEYYMANCKTISQNREMTRKALIDLDFSVTASKSNFLFAKCGKMDGAMLYKKLKECGILVRHFSQADISNYLRITVGTKEQMQALLVAISKILNGEA